MKFLHDINDASMITESTLRRFVSDSEKTAWNSKAAGTHTHDYLPMTGNSTISGVKDFSGELKITGTENFGNVYAKRDIGRGAVGTVYASLSSEIKTGGYHRFWKLSFPTGCNFWGKIKITLYGGYSSYNASGMVAKEINVNFNASSIYSNVGCYTALSGYVEKDFRISEAIWNATTSQWEFWVYSHQLAGNNTPYLVIECWATGTNYITSFGGITFNTVPVFLPDTTYQNVKGNAAGQTLTKIWSQLPTFQNPYGEEIATLDNIIYVGTTQPTSGWWFKEI